MKVYKDHQHSVTLHPFSWQGKRYLMVCVGLYAALDPEGGASSLRTEQDFWKEAPGCFAALEQPPVLDLCLPKPGGEVLVAGFCRTPGKKPVPAQEAAFRVGSVTRRIAVIGERERLPGGGISEPLPFTAMPLVWERAFGGPDFPANPAGKGLDADNTPSKTLPNLEDPEHPLLSRDDRPEPACPFPLAVDNPARRALSGTYDQQWLDTRWPALPDDCDPEFFHSAGPAQRLARRLVPLPGNSSFFQGDEEIELIGMHHEYPHIRSRLPSARIRAFVLTTENFAPFAPPAPDRENGQKPRLPYAKDLDEPGLFREVELRCDTVWLLPDLLGAFVLRRGLLPVEDDEMDDVLRVLVVTEKPADAPHSLEYYRDELKKRAWPAVEIDLAPFVAAQAKTTKTVKMARDVPKMLDRVKKNFLGESPVMPLSLGDMGHSTRKTIAEGRATLDMLERQVLAQREQFSHLMSFDLSMFPKMRATLDAQEKNLEKMLGRAERSIARAERTTKQAVARVHGQMDRARDALKKTDPAGRADAERRIQEALDTLDKFSPEGMLCEPESLNPWHDRGFPLLIAARRALKRNDHLLALLADWGLETTSLENAWIGHSAEAIPDRPELWGLPPAQAAPERPLPAGLYVPRFAGKALISLAVYPLPVDPEDAGRGELRGLGEDAGAIFLAPGSDEKPLSLPAAHPGGAVLVAPEALSALFAEQEAGDFCHIVTAKDPAALAAVEDLPPLVPHVLRAEGGLPLALILPPAPLGLECFKPWQAAYPEAIPLYLPEGCPHVLALAHDGHRLRRLLLDALPPDVGKAHDFDFPLPPKDRPPEPFTLNLPLPTKEELQGRIEALIKDIRSHFPDPETVLAEETAKALNQARAAMRRVGAPKEALAKLEAAFADAARPKAPPEHMSVAKMMETALARIAATRAGLPGDLPPAERAKIIAKLDRSAASMRALGEKLAPLDALREESLAKLEAFKKGDLPEDIMAAFAEKGMDPNALKLLSREEVEAILAGDKNLERRNLSGLDLSGLDFSGARLAHALCPKTLFRGCCMDGVDFTFTIANEADFSEATFRNANFKQTVLQKAVLRQADFSAARLELTTLGECDCSEAVFDSADIKLCNFTKAVLNGARFAQTLLSLSAFSEITASGADFGKVRAFKCLFQKANLVGADFREAVLNECLFQNASAAGISLAKADLRKFYTDMDTDLSGADFSGADLREASLRMSRFRNADFYQATLENTLIAHCDFSRARLDGINASGCRFIKCDLAGADLSGTQLINGALRKCRVNAADLSGANLYAANLCNLVVNAETGIEGTNFKRTILAGKEEALRDAARGNS